MQTIENIRNGLTNGKKLSDLMDGLELKPYGKHCLVVPYINNPYEKVEELESGLILETTPSFKDSSRDGEEKEMYQAIPVGKVVEIGPEVKFVRPGDDVFFYKGSAAPLSFYKQNLLVIAENNVLAIVNKGLTERFNQ